MSPRRVAQSAQAWSEHIECGHPCLWVATQATVEEDARWIARRGDANLAFVEQVAPKLKAAIESEQETEIVVDEEMRQDLVVIFERIEAAGYMTKRMRPVQKVAATPIT
jgi:hypothetical protein